MANPYAELERLHGESPVFYSEKLGYLVLTRMEEVPDVFKNPDIFSAANVQDPVLPICDAALFDNPETFGIHRENARANIAFGRGIHFCLGNRLAIIEATIALKTLTQRIPSLDLVANQRYDFFPNFTFRGPKELWLTWQA
jgi:cytochrome P450